MTDKPHDAGPTATGPTATGPTATGKCLCGDAKFTITGPMRQIVHCYCGQCKRTHGVMGPYSNAKDSDINFTQSKGLKWFASSDFAKRGFCQNCGSSLFWKNNTSDGTAISAGTLDNPTNLKVVGHIFTDDLADFHTLPDDGMPRFAGTSDGDLEGEESI